MKKDDLQRLQESIQAVKSEANQDAEIHKAQCPKAKKVRKIYKKV
jgi:hypothetical protein